MTRAKSNNLKMGLLNVRSLNTGQDDLIASVNNYNIDILALNETWLREGEEGCAPKIPGYQFKHQSRQNGARGGGVGFYVRKELRARVKQHPVSILEQLWLEITVAGRGRIAVGTAYRPESVSVATAIAALDESVSHFSTFDYIYILTDLNINMLDSSQTKSMEMLTFLRQRGLDQLVCEPTRVTDTSATLLDLIITDKPETCSEVVVYHNPGLSDHALVTCILSFKKTKRDTKYIYKRFLNNINITEFDNDLRNLPWNTIALETDINQKVKIFNTLFLLLFDKHAPLQRVRIKEQSKPWLTDTVQLMMRLRDSALARVHKTGKEEHKEYYKQLRNLVSSALERERVAYFSHYVNSNKNNPTLLWKHFKQVSPVGKTSCQKSAIPKHLQSPTCINKHFIETAGTNNVDEGTMEFFAKNRLSNAEFTIRPTTETEVTKIIKNIKTNAAGHDSISISMLRMTLPITLPVITHLVNESIKASQFPDSWKIAKVRPLPKGTKVESYKDLRPISILPVLSKIIERSVCSQLIGFLETSGILPANQSGFRSGFSTETALAHVTDDILEYADKGMATILALLDFSRAFDFINIELLLAKMHYYGISRLSCEWFSSFLKNRQQFVEMENEQGDMVRSSTLTLNKGTPQGSVLSPILFILFTADLPGILKYCTCHLYADDTQVYKSFKSVELKTAIQEINYDLNRIYDWAKRNGLSLNASKSKFMVMGTKGQCDKIVEQNPKIVIGNEAIERVTNARNLGLLMDSHLRFEEHVNNKIRSAFYRLKVLYGVRKYLSEHIRKILVDSLVLSLFNYCDTVYGPRMYEKSAKAIQRVQNACIRFCFKVPNRAHVTPFMNEHNILKMGYRRQVHLTCLVHKTIMKKRPKYLYEKLVWIRDTHNINSRRSQANLLAIPNHRTAGYRGSFKYSATKIWNNLPPPLRRDVSHHYVKSKSKLLLFQIQKASGV